MLFFRMLQDPERLLATQRTIAATQNFLSFFVYAILAALCIGLIVAAATYLARPVLAKLNQFWSVRRWADQRLARARDKKTRTILPDWFPRIAASKSQIDLDVAIERHRGDVEDLSAREKAFASIAETRFWSTALNDELFMHSLQTAAKAAVARPSQYPELFEIVTADAPGDARGAAFAFARLGTTDPAEAGRLADFKSASGSTAAGLASAENLIAASVERALDQLQLSLLKKRVWISRAFCLLVGACLAYVAVFALRSPTPAIFYAIGVAGGVVALVIDDTLVWFFGRSAR
jgi:hypothetical protein